MWCRCARCDNSYGFSAPKCPTCGEANPLAPPPKPPPSKPKERARKAIASRPQDPPQTKPASADSPKSALKPSKLKPSAFPATVNGTLRMTTRGMVLETSLGTWIVHVLSSVPSDLLCGQQRQWRRDSITGSTVMIEPVPNAELRKLEAYVVEMQRRFLLRKVGPRPPGTTSVEQKRSLAERASEIDRLAKVNNPSSWADIASCWSIAAIRPVTEAAMAQIGWSRISWLVNCTAGWPDGLHAVVQHELEKLQRTSYGLPWRPDDYLLSDW